MSRCGSSNKPTTNPTTEPTNDLSVDPTKSPTNGPTMNAIPDSVVTLSVHGHGHDGILTLDPTKEPTAYPVMDRVPDSMDSNGDAEDAEIAMISSFVLGGWICLVLQCMLCKWVRRKIKERTLSEEQMLRNLSIQESVEMPYTTEVRIKQEVELPRMPTVEDDTGTKGMEFESMEMEDRKERERESVRNWLESIGMTEHYDAFMENGYDSMAIIQSITIQQELQEIGILSTAHQTLLMAEIGELSK